MQSRGPGRCASDEQLVLRQIAVERGRGHELRVRALPDDPAQPVTTDPKMAGIAFQGSISEYLSLTTKFILAFGLSFQLPVALTLMGKAGLVSAAGLASMRRYAIILILVLAAMVTPPDIISQLVLFSVIYALYEIAIQLVKRIETKREAQLRAEGLWVDDE